MSHHGLQTSNNSRLVQIFDEDNNGDVTLQEYYNALDTYNCRGEPDQSPFGADSLMTYQTFCVFKLIKMLQDRGFAHDEFYRMADVNNDGNMDTVEMK